MVVEGIHLQHIAHSDVALRKGIDTYTAWILNGDLRAGLRHEGIAHQASQLLAGFERCIGNGQHTAQGGVVIVETDHLLNHLHGLGEFPHVDVFSFLIHYLAVFHGEGDIGHTVQLVPVLGDQHAVLHLVAL